MNHIIEFEMRFMAVDDVDLIRKEWKLLVLDSYTIFLISLSRCSTRLLLFFSILKLQTTLLVLILKSQNAVLEQYERFEILL